MESFKESFELVSPHKRIQKAIVYADEDSFNTAQRGRVLFICGI